MSELVRNLLADRSSGVRSGADGHRFFRQRRVTFETILMDAAELHGADWLEYREAVPLLNWDQSPSHRAIQSFARESSERFLSFWYRVFDVAIARAIFGRDTNILEVAFMRPTFFFDIGIPADVRHSSIPPGLHYKILSEYDAARSIPLSYRIYYLSNYLDGLTDDLIATLQPYQHLWQKRRERRQLQYEEFNRLYRASRAVLDAPVASESVEPETVLTDAL
ncbi:MAG: hypothetical protein KDK30_15965, partial [Leptospiraceae bacterium]|nr:hypothetical protein [Leptospiraceae bacterium]